MIQVVYLTLKVVIFRMFWPTSVAHGKTSHAGEQPIRTPRPHYGNQIWVIFLQHTKGLGEGTMSPSDVCRLAEKFGVSAGAGFHSLSTVIKNSN